MSYLRQKFCLFGSNKALASQEQKYQIECQWCGNDLAYDRLRPDTQHYGELICGRLRHSFAVRGERHIKWLRKPSNGGEVIL